MKQLKDVDSEFLNWFLDLLDLDINRKIKILESKNINFKLEFSTKLNKHPIDLTDKKIDKNNLFKPEGFLKIRYNHRAALYHGLARGVKSDRGVTWQR